MQLDRRFVACIAFLSVACVLTRTSYGQRRNEEMPRTSERTWRPMHTAWKYDIEIGHGRSYGSIIDLVCRGNRILSVATDEVVCLDKSTGHVLWRFDAGARPKVDWSRVAVDDRYVYIAERTQPGEAISDKVIMSLRALRLDNGKVAWKQSLPWSPVVALCLAGDMLIAPLEDGTALAVKCADGRSVWHKEITDSGFRSPESDLAAVLQVTNGVAIAQIGEGLLVAFRIRDGAKLWSYPQQAPPWAGHPDGMAIKAGVVYANLHSADLVALDAKTGRLLWQRKDAAGYGNSNAVAPFGDLILSDLHGSSVVAVHRQNGHTAWVAEQATNSNVKYFPSHLPGQHKVRGETAPGSALLEVRQEFPRINGVQKRWRSNPWPLPTLVAIDPSNGKEQWRWQPEEGHSIDKIASDGNRIYVSDGGAVRAIIESAPTTLPIEPECRREVAARMVAACFQGSGETNGMDPRLTLLRLGADSAPALLGFVQQEITKREKLALNRMSRTYCATPSVDNLSVALDMLSDIGVPMTVPALLQDLDRTKNPVSRQLIAECLTQIGDSRAAPALFHYAEASREDLQTRIDALVWVCRVPETALPQQQVTDYLLTCLSDTSIPIDLRLFARFELLNGRGSKAVQAALAIFAAGGRGTPASQNRPPAIRTQVLIDEEGIYQAVVEALCLVGRAKQNHSDASSGAPPRRFGDSRRTLDLYLPHGSAGIEIFGHPGPVRFHTPPVGTTAFYPIMDEDTNRNSDHFSAPHIDLAGVFHDPESWRVSSVGPATDPFIPVSARAVRVSAGRWTAFRDYFPYERSADGNRARVGWDQELEQARGYTWFYFDIEVRKIDGRWVPVECRPVLTEFQGPF